MSANIDLGLLGPLEVRRGDEQVRIAAPKQRALLALLALHVGRVVSADELADRLWAGNPPDSAATALQVYISQLRKLLGAGVILTRRPGYMLDLSPESVDTVRFERLVADGRSLLASGHPDSAEAVLTEALSCWRSDALAEFVYENWAASPVRRLQELRLVALEDRIEAQLLRGQGAELTGELEGLVGEHPLRERLRGQHMLALYRAGRQADALIAYQDARRALVDGLGIDPSPALVALERQILQQDAALVPVAPTLSDVHVQSIHRAAPQPVAAVAGSNPPQESVCTLCGSAVPMASKYCSECGAAVAAAPPTADRQRRKLVTVLFCDLVGSTALAERLDAEVVRTLIDRFFDSASAVVSRHGGSVEKFIGDAVVAIFGVPLTHEDDALRAVRAAAEIGAAVEHLANDAERQWGARIAVRIGVNTGEVVVGADASGSTMATGDTVNVAARLEQSAGAGEIVLGDATWQLVRDAVSAEAMPLLTLKGKAEAVAAHRLVEVRTGTEGHKRRMDLPLVGRERERNLLRDSYERWVAERACGLITILGTAGVGKSRLVAELLVELGSGPVTVQGRCLPYGSGITYWPLAEAIRQLAGVDDDHTPQQVRQRVRSCLEGAEDADRVSEGVLALIGAAEADAGVEDSRWAVRRLIEHVARPRPLILVVDDLQWAEPPLLELVDGLLDAVHDVPVLLLCVARPELLDRRPDWGGGKLNATTILLEPLGSAQTNELVGHLLGGRQTPDELLERVAAAAAGNPLFAEELIAYLQERGHIAVSGDTVEVSRTLGELELPPTIRAIISARLDQLPNEERAVLERGSVEGEVFHAGTVIALTGDDTASACTAELQRLVRKQVLKPDHAQLPGQDAFRFRHLLIRDSTYEGIPKHRRAEWHRSFAEWLEDSAGERAAEYEKIVAYHYATSHRYHTELGTPDERLRERAATLLRRSADRSISQNDLTTGAVLLTQLLQVMPSDRERTLTLADCAVLQAHTGQWEEARRSLEEAIAAAADDARSVQIYVDAASAVARARMGSAVAASTELVMLAEESGAADWHDAAAMAWWSVAYNSEVSADLTRRAAERCREHARAAGLGWLVQQADFMEGVGCSSGSLPIPEAMARCEALFPATTTRQLTLVLRGVHLGWLAAMGGDLDDADALFAAARACAAEVETLEQWPDYRHGRALAYLGLAERAIPYLVGSITSIERHGRDLGAEDAAAAAYAFAQSGRAKEALGYIRRAEKIVMPNDLLATALLCGARAQMHLIAGQHADACSEARREVEVLEPTDYADTLGRALIDLASVLLQSGKPGEARRTAQRAVELLTRRGAVPMVKLAQITLTDAELLEVT